MKQDLTVKEVDIYDFDKTMIPFDSGSLFWAYCLLHYPWTFICVPYQIAAGILFALKKINLTKMKGPFFSFVRLIPKEKAAKKFWDKHEKDVYDWGKRGNRERYSVMVSASPDFLLKEIAKRIDIDDFICTKHDENGKVIGKNCHDKEKVILFRERYPDAKVVNVFSDSIENDKYIFSLAEHCFNTVNGKKIPFDFDSMYRNK